MRIEELMNMFPATCGPDETLGEAEQKMQNSNCAVLPVMAGDEPQCLVGVITDGDIGMAKKLGGRNPQELRVRDAMARKLRICGPEDSIFEAEAIMQEASIRFLPVVDRSGHLLGVLSLADVSYQVEQEREALSAQVSAALFALLASRIHEPQRADWPRNVARPAHALEASGDR